MARGLPFTMEKCEGLRGFGGIFGEIPTPRWRPRRIAAVQIGAAGATAAAIDGLDREANKY